jgi:hypothetical protein
MAKGGGKGKGGGAGGRDQARDRNGRFASIGAARSLLMSTARRVGDGPARPSSVALVKARTGLRKALGEARVAARGDNPQYRREAARQLDVTARLVARAAARAESDQGKSPRTGVERKTLEDKLGEAMERTSGARSLLNSYTSAWKALPADASYSDRTRRSKDMVRARKSLEASERYEGRLLARARRVGLEV